MTKTYRKKETEPKLCTICMCLFHPVRTHGGEVHRAAGEVQRAVKRVIVCYNRRDFKLTTNCQPFKPAGDKYLILKTYTLGG